MATQKVLQGMLEHGNLVLECEGGKEVKACRHILSLTSPHLRDLIATAACSHSSETPVDKPIRLKMSDTTVEQWQLVLGQVYPIVERRRLALQEIYDILPLVHKYDITEFLRHITQRLITELPSLLSLERDSIVFVFKWLHRAEDLQLDELKDVCLAAFKQPWARMLGSKSGKFDAELKALSNDTLLQLTKLLAANVHCRFCNGGSVCQCNLANASVAVYQVVDCSTCMMSREMCQRCKFRRC